IPGNLKTHAEGFCPPVFISSASLGNHVSKSNRTKLIQKKQEEKQIQEDQAANAQYWKIPAYYDDDDDYNFAITPDEPSSVENLVPNPSESEGENGCDVPSGFTTFSNTLFDAEYEFDSSNDQSLSNEDFSKEIFSNPLFEEEIISTKIDPHHFDAESDLIESMLNRDSSIIPSSSKIDSLLNEFADELTLLKSIPPRIDKTDCYLEEDIRFTKRLLYDYSSPRPPKEFDESFYFDIPSFSCPPTKPPDGNTGILNIKAMGDVSDQKYSRKLKDSYRRILSSNSSFP
nr:hypothetical protein [Tanacetum cinerariifolium]